MRNTIAYIRNGTYPIEYGGYRDFFPNSWVDHAGTIRPAMSTVITDSVNPEKVCAIWADNIQSVVLDWIAGDPNGNNSDWHYPICPVCNDNEICPYCKLCPVELAHKSTHCPDCKCCYRYQKACLCGAACEWCSDINENLVEAAGHFFCDTFCVVEHRVAQKRNG